MKLEKQNKKSKMKGRKENNKHKKERLIQNQCQKKKYLSKCRIRQRKLKRKRGRGRRRRRKQKKPKISRSKIIPRMSMWNHPVDDESDKDYGNEDVDDYYDIMDEKLLDALILN